MERLTEEMQIGPFATLKDKASAIPGAFNTYDCFYAHMVSVTRLKQYEDTGLEPEEIMEMKRAWSAACSAYGFNHVEGEISIKQLGLNMMPDCIKEFSYRRKPEEAQGKNMTREEF